jgi:hypothetical protein
LPGFLVLTWISGPSASSDSELEQVEGRYGPPSLEVVLLVPDGAREPAAAGDLGLSSTFSVRNVSGVYIVNTAIKKLADRGRADERGGLVR